MASNPITLQSSVANGFTNSTPPFVATGIGLPSSGSALAGAAGPVVWALAALAAIALAGTLFSPVVIALLAAAIWWQFLHARKG